MHNFEPGQKVVVKCNILKGNDENRINRRKVARKARFLDKVNGFYGAYMKPIKNSMLILMLINMLNL